MPYTYIAHSIESCWEADDEVDENDDDVTTGSTQRCTSSYGPNAGKFKPGVVQEDGLGPAATHIQWALYTENKTVIISRFANHPLQVHVEIEDFTDATSGDGNITKMEFQLYDDTPESRQFCAHFEEPIAEGVTLENSTLSFLGSRNGLRHWAISDEESNERVADYFDYDTPDPEPHSVHMWRGEATFSEVRYLDFQQNLTEADVESWLNEHFIYPEVHDAADFTACEKVDMNTDVPDQLNAFSEDFDHVDW
jgi:hypothetical protein